MREKREFVPVSCSKCQLLLLKAAPVGSMTWCNRCGKPIEAKPIISQGVKRN